ncbi:MAG: septation protein IspZ [Alphaproteobacteria bacterium]|nr:septation protein IspZ [Alphaproteobacteria bacterium]
MNLIIELVPTFLFVAVYALSGAAIFKATLAGMVSSTVGTMVYYIIFKRITALQMVLLMMLLILGGLTIYFETPKFIKLLPTVIYFSGAAAVVLSMYNKKPILRIMFGKQFLKNEKKIKQINLWDDMSYHFGGFLFFLAMLNLVVMKWGSTTVWVYSKLAIFFLFLCFIVWELRWAYKKISPKSSFTHWLKISWLRHLLKR